MLSYTLINSYNLGPMLAIIKLDSICLFEYILLIVTIISVKEIFIPIIN